MEERIIKNYIEAGRMSAKALDYGKLLIKNGNSLLETTQKIEDKIIELGGNLAFPVQISCDQIAAHFCPDVDNTTIFDKQVVSLDLGVHVNGAIGDNAYTIDLSGNYGDLVKASQKALEEALKIINVGTELREIGKIIDSTIKSYGYNPIRNLSGHGLDLYSIHTNPTIPNIDNGSKLKLTKDMAFAVEPFATTGSGMIHESGIPTVFQLEQHNSVRNLITREVLKEIEIYGDLPFAKRWLVKKFGAKASFALRDLNQLGMVHQYPPLVEVTNGIVTQAEHSVLIDGKGEVIILTKE